MMRDADIDAVNIGGEFEPFEQGDRSNELVAAQLFAEALRQSGGAALTNISLNPSDPPDCYARLNGSELGIEVTRLVIPEILGRRRLAHQRGEPVHVHTEHDPWTEERFRNEVQARIDDKEAKYRRRSIANDIMLVVTTERWLFPQDVSAWLQKAEFAKPTSFRVGFIMLQHNPAWSACRPVMRLFGSTWP